VSPPRPTKSSVYSYSRWKCRSSACARSLDEPPPATWAASAAISGVTAERSRVGLSPEAPGGTARSTGSGARPTLYCTTPVGAWSSDTVPERPWITA
jgi:hypothetical protein